MARASKADENAQARELVRELKAGGMSYGEIGRRLGRNPSVVSQIARGAPKGAAYVGALREIQAGATKVNVERRKTAAGTEAKVRHRGVSTIPGTDNLSVRTSKTAKGGDAAITSTLEQMKGKNKYVRWNVHFGRTQTISPPKRARARWVPSRYPVQWTPEKLLDRINNPGQGDTWQPGEARAALAGLARQQNASTIVSAINPDKFELFTLD